MLKFVKEDKIINRLIISSVIAILIFILSFIYFKNNSKSIYLATYEIVKKSHVDYDITTSPIISLLDYKLKLLALEENTKFLKPLIFKKKKLAWEISSYKESEINSVFLIMKEALSNAQKNIIEEDTKYLKVLENLYNTQSKIHQSLTAKKILDLQSQNKNDNNNNIFYMNKDEIDLKREYNLYNTSLSIFRLNQYIGLIKTEPFYIKVTNRTMKDSSLIFLAKSLSIGFIFFVFVNIFIFYFFTARKN